MMVLLVNGSKEEHGIAQVSLKEAEAVLEKNGIDVSVLWAGENSLQGCVSCGKCRKLGKCIFDGDAVNEAVHMADAIDGLIIAVPVIYGKPEIQSVSFLDRLFTSAGKKLAGKPAAAVLLSRSSVTLSFDGVYHYFETHCMPIVTSQSLPVVHQEEDAEGMQAIRMMAENMSWLLKCIEEGKKKGISLPEAEPPVRNPFIR